MTERKIYHRGIIGWLRGGSSGQALVETALTLPMLLLVLIGVAELSRVAYAAIEVSNSARAAAQYAAMNGGAFSTTDTSGLDTSGMLAAAQADSGNLSNGVSFKYTPTYSCTCSGTGTASCTPMVAPSGCVGSHLIISVTVITQMPYSTVIHVPGLQTKFQLEGKAVEQVLQ